jgi:hypothetical protein
LNLHVWCITNTTPHKNLMIMYRIKLHFRLPKKFFISIAQQNKHDISSNMFNWIWWGFYCFIAFWSNSLCKYHLFCFDMFTLRFSNIKIYLIIIPIKILRMISSTFVSYETNSNFLFQIQWKFTKRYFDMRTTCFHLPNWYFSDIDKKRFVATYTIIFLWSRCVPIIFLEYIFHMNVVEV